MLAGYHGCPGGLAGRKMRAQLFAASPFKGLDIDFERDPDYGRAVTLFGITALSAGCEVAQVAQQAQTEAIISS